MANLTGSGTKVYYSYFISKNVYPFDDKYYFANQLI